MFGSIGFQVVCIPSSSPDDLLSATDQLRWNLKMVDARSRLDVTNPAPADSATLTDVLNLAKYQPFFHLYNLVAQNSTQLESLEARQALPT